MTSTMQNIFINMKILFCAHRKQISGNAASVRTRMWWSCFELSASVHKQESDFPQVVWTEKVPEWAWLRQQLSIWLSIQNTCLYIRFLNSVQWARRYWRKNRNERKHFIVTILKWNNLIFHLEKACTEWESKQSTNCYYHSSKYVILITQWRGE